MAIQASDVMKLRQSTGSAVMECKKALVETGGDFDKAVEVLRKRGVAKAAKKVERETMQGMVGTYIHSNGKIGAMVELCCESDFVARNDEFQQLLKDLCMQVAATAPLAIAPEDLSQELLDREREIYRAEAAGKPDNIVDRIVEGKLKKFYEEKCLLEQPFIKEDKVKVKDLITQLIAKLGENMRVRRFARFELGAD